MPLGQSMSWSPPPLQAQVVSLDIRTPPSVSQGEREGTHHSAWGATEDLQQQQQQQSPPSQQQPQQLLWLQQHIWHQQQQQQPPLLQQQVQQQHEEQEQLSQHQFQQQLQQQQGQLHQQLAQQLQQQQGLQTQLQDLQLQQLQQIQQQQHQQGQHQEVHQQSVQLTDVSAGADLPSHMQQRMLCEVAELRQEVEGLKSQVRSALDMLREQQQVLIFHAQEKSEFIQLIQAERDERGRDMSDLTQALQSECNARAQDIRELAKCLQAECRARAGEVEQLAKLLQAERVSRAADVEDLVQPLFAEQASRLDDVEQVVETFRSKLALLLPNGSGTLGSWPLDQAERSPVHAQAQHALQAQSPVHSPDHLHTQAAVMQGLPTVQVIRREVIDPASHTPRGRLTASTGSLASPTTPRGPNRS